MNIVKHLLIKQLKTTATPQTAVIPCQPKAMQLPQQPASPAPPVIVMPSTKLRPLSELIEIGRHYHRQARHDFVQKWSNNHYFVQHRIEELRTCALAAAYVAHFGPYAINEYTSRSMVETELEPIIGYHPALITIIGPVLYDSTNQPYQRTFTISALVQYLNDHEGWTRQAIGRELAKQGL